MSEYVAEHSLTHAAAIINAMGDDRNEQTLSDVTALVVSIPILQTVFDLQMAREHSARYGLLATFSSYHDPLATPVPLHVHGRDAHIARPCNARRLSELLRATRPHAKQGQWQPSPCAAPSPSSSDPWAWWARPSKPARISWFPPSSPCPRCVVLAGM